jgi:hypothetical protein
MTTTAETKLTAEEQYQALATKMRDMGFRVPERDAWKRTIGHMAGSMHFLRAMDLGAAMREEINRQSLEELDADS